MSQYVLLRIQSLQEELESLKKIVSHQLLQGQRKTTYIKGLWKDFEISDDDFADARNIIPAHPRNEVACIFGFCGMVQSAERRSNTNR
jgi:hypothetical protein